MEGAETTISFGYWVRRHRMARDLTQAQLADLAGCSRAMLRKIETDERRPSEALAASLADVLALALAEREAFLAVARREVSVSRLALPTAPVAWGDAPGSLPAALTPLHGREQALAGLVALLRDPARRCVTLVGPGGVGKTRLAVAAAEAVRREGREQVCFVPLAALRQPELLLGAVAQALGLRGTAPAAVQLRAWLQRRAVLLLLDNLEQLVEAAGDLAALVAASPGLRLLVTSRAPLRIAAEQIVDVPPLELPPEPDGPIAADALARAPAAAMFLERAASVRPMGALSPHEGAAIAAIVRRLDGLPLAIELAAAQARLLAPHDLLALLDDRLGLLVDGPRDLPARQRTLRDVVRWSYDLVAPDARATFARLAVFAGGFDREAASAVDARPGTVARLGALLNASLIHTDAARPGRYGMLATIAEYARERLVEQGELAAARARHAHWFAALGRSAAAGLCGAGRRAWIERLDLELADIRAALSWAIHAGGDVAAGVQLASDLRQFWHLRGHHREGRAWLAAGAALLPADQRELHGRALLADGYLAWFQRAYPDAQRSLGRAVALLGEPHVADARAESLALLAVAALRADDGAAQATALAAEAVELAHGAGGPWLIGMARFWQAVVAAYQADGRGAAASARASIEAFAAAGDAWNGGPHSILGDLALAAGDARAAEAHYADALRCFRAIQDLWGCAFSLRTLAEIAMRAGDFGAARRHASESLALWRALGDTQAQSRVAQLLASLPDERAIPPAVHSS